MCNSNNNNTSSLFGVLRTGTLERTGGEGVGYAVGAVFGAQIVSAAHRVAQVLRVAHDNNRLGGGDDARQGPVELRVRAHITGLVRPHTVQVNITL